MNASETRLNKFLMTLREWIFLAGIASHRPQQYVIVTLLTFFCFLTLTSKQKYPLAPNGGKTNQCHFGDLRVFFQGTQ